MTKDVENQSKPCSCVEEVAYKLFQTLRDHIHKQKANFDDMQDRDRQQYLLELYRSCLETVKLQRPHAPEIGPKKV